MGYNAIHAGDDLARDNATLSTFRTVLHNLELWYAYLTFSQLNQQVLPLSSFIPLVA